MIKLNNKKITYVALADSSNSLKAPKEIWYADSSNSVKLVYRRKDALIEGEDYEKYHWLKGDGAYFVIPVNPYQEFLYVKFHPTSSESNHEFWSGYYNIHPNYPIEIRGMIGGSNELGIRFGIRENNVATSIVIYKTGLDYLSDFSIETQYSEDNKVNYTFNGTSGIATPIIDSRANVNVWVAFRTTWCKFAKVTTDRINLIPCKLLKPVPKWLDANGIRRQVGECGMIDLVSGKFYGNVNSVGTFTVENYYERKEQLITENSNGDLMMSLPLNTYNFSLKRRILELSGNCYHFLKGTTNYYTSTTHILSVYVDGVSTFSSIAQTSFGDDIEIKSTNDSLTFNGEAVPIPDSKFTYLRFKKSVAGTIMKISTSSVIVNGVERYIPCTLTMDLPASMDANNIARTKGTSGMWDLVSDRFYGNVASSGTFKAVNLAEGVDYEVHQWLKGDGSAYIDTLVNKLKGTITVDIDRTAVTSNSNILGREAYSGLGYESRCVVNLLRQNNNYIADIYGVRTTSGYGVNINMVDTLYLDLDTKIASTKSGNSKSIDIRTDIGGYNMLLFAKNSGSAPSYCWSGSIGSFKMADIIDLTPVRLLRPIPAELDANGIARQAGECGMYDTVNDLFYGNVASSGTFSVSDDS